MSLLKLFQLVSGYRALPEVEEHSAVLRRIIDCSVQHLQLGDTIQFNKTRNAAISTTARSIYVITTRRLPLIAFLANPRERFRADLERLFQQLILRY